MVQNLVKTCTIGAIISTHNNTIGVFASEHFESGGFVRHIFRW